ncbi:MAG TPA: deaminase [Streptosporangiaceae bacterium]|nr:deaminase [Streptosporangiaceae bacterium]
MRRDDDVAWLTVAVELASQCPPSDSAFSVGAILIGRDRELIAKAFSRQEHHNDHAEEIVLRRAADFHSDLSGACLYSSLEPCLSRSSRPVPCAELVVRSGIRRVVIAWREPPIFQPGGGAAWLEEQGVTLIEIPELADAAAEPNRGLLDRA